jgi:hypothetical protein
MGGPGSTRWRGHTPKALVENTPTLDLQHPRLQAALAQPGPVPGVTSHGDDPRFLAGMTQASRAEGMQ